MKNNNISFEDVEIMSPAGSFESLNAAIKAGADSVYFGAGKLNMRSRSSVNFTSEDIDEVVKIAREHSVKTYLALNTIIYGNELLEVDETLLAAKNSGVDAVIAADIAVVLKAFALGIRVHISVQANVCNIETVKFFSKFADVMVLARELTLDQIKEITECIENEDIRGPSGKLVRIEVFAHGALCVSVSGKCFMSLDKYNSSANRGACFQNCRRSYRVIDETDGNELVLDNKFVMSPKDICLIRCLDQILGAGVKVLKIEGRGRSADYVYSVTKAYKGAVLSIKEGEYTEDKKDYFEAELKKVFNRGFWHGGYYLGKEADMWSGNPDNKAVKKKIRIGIVNKYFEKAGIAEVVLCEGDLSVGEEFIITGTTTGVRTGIIKEIMVDEKFVDRATKGSLITFPVAEKIRKNDRLFALRDEND